MTSKFQKNLFPSEKLAKMQSIVVRTIDGSIIILSYQELKLCTVGNQVCWVYKADDGDLIMPIARTSKIDSLEEY